MRDGGTDVDRHSRDIFPTRWMGAARWWSSSWDGSLQSESFFGGGGAFYWKMNNRGNKQKKAIFEGCRNAYQLFGEGFFYPVTRSDDIPLPNLFLREPLPPPQNLYPQNSFIPSLV